MVNVDTAFHTATLAQAPETRIRVYFIGDSVDCTDDTDVTTNGTLLKWAATDTDSNGRISIGGVSFSETFTKETNWEIGTCTSNTVSMSLLNDDGGLNSFTYGRCKIYLDVKSGSTWYPCPMGVYYIDTPAKRATKTVSVSGYDAMQVLDKYADDWWNGLNFESGITLSGILSSMATNLGFSLKPGMTVLNGTQTYTSAPIQASKTTYRSILANLAGTACANARFDRNGYLELKWFGTASPSFTSLFSADISEYTAAAVTGLEVLASSLDVGVTVGTTTNPYTITDNCFLYGETATAITAIATPIYTRMAAFTAYRPASVSLQYDWSVEAGDIVSYTYGQTTYTLPIFQQRLKWLGGYVTAELDCTGDATRPVETEDSTTTLTQYKDRKAMHELENSLDTLRSTISSTEGDVTELQQTATSIIASVASVSQSVQRILDPSGEMWTFMNNLSATVSSNNTTTEAQFDTISTYIRFVNGSIVLGKSDSDIKLKIMPDAMMFYSGADTETSLSNAIAYFTFEQFFESVIKSSDYVQLGTGSGSNWQWVKRSNGHVTLWRV